MIRNRTAEIEPLMIETRERTLGLFNLASEEHLRESPGHGFRPIIWHLAHIGVFEAYWLLQQLGGERALDDQYERIFDPIKTPREDSVNLPSRFEMEEFLARVRDRTLPVLREFRPQPNDSLRRDAYVFDLVLEHEYQHQETLAYLLQLLDRPKTAPPTIREDRAKLNVSASPPPRDMVAVPAGDFQMGSTWNGFAYDNELPAHVVNIPAYRIDRCLTTNQEYVEFIEKGGYERREWWSEEGWTWRARESWVSPRYWKRKDGVWFDRTMFG
ncbi:MAG: SUMF1/EgtB/PvdO family nonheme iron enzyme, partial [Pyrinomonadaceae bacterium]